MMQGERHKIYAGADVESLGLGGALTWSNIRNGGVLIGATFSIGFGISPFLLDCGYNFGNMNLNY
jgi:hypothetical protein